MAGLVFFNKAVIDKGVDVLVGDGHHAAAFAAIAAIRAATGHKFFTTHTGRAIAATTAHDFNPCFINKFHHFARETSAFMPGR